MRWGFATAALLTWKDRPAPEPVCPKNINVDCMLKINPEAVRIGGTNAIFPHEGRSRPACHHPRQSRHSSPCPVTPRCCRPSSPSQPCCSQTDGHSTPTLNPVLRDCSSKAKDTTQEALKAPKGLSVAASVPAVSQCICLAAGRMDNPVPHCPNYSPPRPGPHWYLNVPGRGEVAERFQSNSTDSQKVYCGHRVIHRLNPQPLFILFF